MTSNPELPEPIDISAPGVLSGVDLKIYSLGNERFVVALSHDFSDLVKGSSGNGESLTRTLRKALGEHYMIISAESGDAWQPLEKSEELKDLIRQAVDERLAALLDHKRFVEIATDLAVYVSNGDGVAYSVARAIKDLSGMLRP